MSTDRTLSSLDGVAVANAALIEVGLQPTAVRLSNGILHVASGTPSRPHYRASILGRIADAGTDLILVRCFTCSYGRAAPPYPEPCVSARDALLWVTCGTTDDTDRDGDR